MKREMKGDSGVQSKGFKGFRGREEVCYPVPLRGVMKKTPAGDYSINTCSCGSFTDGLG
jgi:hypothetical protein